MNARAPLAEGLAFIFDMDGVIIDSNPIHRAAWEAYNLRFGLVTTEAMHQSMYGKRNDEIVRHFFGALPEEEVFARGAEKEALFREMIREKIESILVTGIRTFLDTYRTIPMAVASNAEPQNLAFVLETSGLRRYFRAVVDGHQVLHPKPHPDIYLQASDALGTAVRDCIVFEDSHAGVTAARAAGMRVIGVRTTHVYLPGTELTIDNFLSGELTKWLAAQTRAA